MFPHLPLRQFLSVLVLFVLTTGLSLPAIGQPIVYVPTAADGATVSSDSDPLCLGCTIDDLANVIGDEALSARMTLPLGVLAGARIRVDLPASEEPKTHPGFVIRSGGGLVDVAVLDRLTIRTYLGEALQEEAAGSGRIEASARANGQTRLHFRALAPYDAIEIEVAGAALVLTDVDVYYAVLTRPSPVERIVALADAGATATGATSGLCLACTVTNLGQSIDAPLVTAATISVPLGVAGGASVTVDYGMMLPERSWTGFWVSSNADLLDAQVLGALTIEVLDGSTVVAQASGKDLRITQRPDGIAYVRIRTSDPFDTVRIETGSLVGLSIELNVHQAMTVPINPVASLDEPSLAVAPTARADSRSARALSLSAPAPNPFRGETRLSLTAPDAASVRVAAYDALGREVALLHDGPVADGGEILRFNASALAPGTYVVRALADHVSAQRVVTVAR